MVAGREAAVWTRVRVGDWWQYLGCASGNTAHMSISTIQGSASSRSLICSTQNVPEACVGSVDVTTLGGGGGAQPNVFLRCLPAVAAVATGGGIKNAFVIVQITRFQQVIGVFTLQAPSEAIKVRIITGVTHTPSASAILEIIRYFLDS